MDTYTNFEKVDETKNNFEKITDLSPSTGELQSPLKEDKDDLDDILNLDGELI